MDKLWLIPLLPLCGFLVLTLVPMVAGHLPKSLTALVGAGSIGLAALITLWVGSAFVDSGDTQYSQAIGQWFSVGPLGINFGLHLDALSLTMLGVITGIGFLIHIYATGFMGEDPGYSRFFSYMNLFVAAMITLVLADNLVLLYLGWEGVGLCSYLLIGFWYDNPHNGYCARKAFIVTRVGDTAMAIGLFLLFKELGGLHIAAILEVADGRWPQGDITVTVIAFLLLGGAVGKSAQLPLQTWLPDAMAGPTPISALIHAATMVTAGVYLIARMHPLFLLAPSAQLAVAFIGAATLLMAGFSALTQSDIKRILAYSTVSQIGYMFLALGVGAWSGAIFHLMTHAFFKALLFLGAGTVIMSLHHEHNIFNMGGMRKKLPLAFACFMIGSAALAALPFTAGYFSKHDIMLAVWSFPEYGATLWWMALLGAFLTALYSFRLVFLVFFGESQYTAPVSEAHDFSMSLPLVALCLLALVGGYWNLDLDTVLPLARQVETPTAVNWLTTLMPFAGLLLSYALFGGRWLNAEALLQTRFTRMLHQFWFNGWGVDWLYQQLLVRPWLALARGNKRDLFDHAVTAIAALNRIAYISLAFTQTGRLRWYATSLALGLVLLLGLAFV